MAIKALEQKPCNDLISRQAVDTLVDELARAISDERCCMSRGRSTATIMQDILDLPSVTQEPKTDVLEDIKAEIKEWYWQADKQAIAKDPCIVDAMIDLFIRTIDAHISGEPQESEDAE